MSDGPAETPEASGFVPFADYLKLGDEEQVYLIEPLIPMGGTAVLFAKEKAGKLSLIHI